VAAKSAVTRRFHTATQDQAPVGKSAATQRFHMAAQDRAQAGRLLVPRLHMPAYSTHPLPAAAVVGNMPPVASRMAKNTNC